jgi:hypothetical protein
MGQPLLCDRKRGRESQRERRRREGGGGEREREREREREVGGRRKGEEALFPWPACYAAPWGSWAPKDLGELLRQEPKKRE